MAEQTEDIIVINECECGCGCGDVELRMEKEPEIILFDEYAEPYESEIIRAREAAEETLAYMQEKVPEIISKENLLLDDTTTIKRELHQGVTEIKAEIEQIIIDQVLTECSEEEVYAMFPINDDNN